MFRHALPCALLVALTLGCARRGAGGDRPAPVAEEQAVPETAEREQPTRRFTGTLRGGIVAIGAETTGWVLEADDLGRVDVDVSKVADAAAGLDGKRVVIDAALVTANWTERGEKRMLIAEAIRAASDGR